MFEDLKAHFSIFTRNLQAIEYLENFFMAAVFSIVAIRVFLRITGYPQIGGEGLHIAHMLWGGLLMLIAIIVLLNYLNKEAKNLAAVIGGLGFGTFIDELGKFITSDNDYFYQPTIALIYIIFVVIFLTIRALDKYIKPSDKEYMINAMEVTKEVVMHDLDEDEKKRALRYLKKADQTDPVVKELKKLITSSKLVPRQNLYIITRIREFSKKIYLNVIRRRRIQSILLSAFILILVYSLVETIIRFDFSFWDKGYVLSTILSVFFALWAGYHLTKRNRLVAYDKMRYAVLVSVFFRQFFRFYHSQLLALLGLVLDLSILIGLQYLVTEEKKIEK